jgi:LacI family transcriptional regulator
VPSHPFRIREIAVQAGLSEATVDRVLNGRSGVRDSTAREVRAAIADLERQRDQVRLAGRTFLIDVVMQAPAGSPAPSARRWKPSSHCCAPRSSARASTSAKTGPAGHLLETLDGIGRRGTQGIILKAPDVSEVNESVARLAARRIPVVTLVTDLPRSPRTAYIGIDNRAAGATAAYLITQWLRAPARGRARHPQPQLLPRRRGARDGIPSALRSMQPSRRVVDVTETNGLDAAIRGLVVKALTPRAPCPPPTRSAAGNTAILDAFAESGRPAPLLIAHDLDEDNIRLLRGGRVAAVLHHDLRVDLRRASQVIMSAQNALPDFAVDPSAIQVVTPYNVP